MSMSEKASVIYEPMTSITDFLIFILGCYYGWYTLSLLNSVFHLIWGISFFVLGFGALLGGVKHGFGPKFSKTQKNYLVSDINFRWYILSMPFFITFCFDK